MCPAARILRMRTGITSATTPSIRNGTRSPATEIRSARGSMSTLCARVRTRLRCTPERQHEMSADYSPSEMMTIAAARALTNDDVCFVGIGAPSAACNLARLTHAPDIVLIYESGTIETKPNILPLSIGDGELCETALVTVSVPEMFRYWLQGG